MAADCGPWLHIFPSRTYISAHSLLLLEGSDWGGGDDIITCIGKGYDTCLKSKFGDDLALEVVEIYRQGNYRQVLLKPIGNPVYHTRYELQVDHAETPNYLYKLGPGGVYGSFGQPVEYVFVDKAKEHGQPSVKTRPKLLELRLVQYGCGPEQLAIFDFPVSDESDVLVKTTVKNLRTMASSTFYLIPRDGKIEVGHYMCGGAFYFYGGDRFEFSFDFMDTDWNVTPWQGPPLEIDVSSIVMR